MSEKDDKYFGDFFGSSLVDHNWLAPDPKAYQAIDNLPKQNLDTQPDMEKMWNHSTDPVRFDLAPNKEYGTLQAADVQQTGMEALAAAKTIASVEKFAKECMMKGFTSQQVGRLLATKFDKSALETSKEVLAKLAGEYGLLGHVYADVDSYSKCYLGEGENIVEAAKTARFVKAKETCGGCVYNQRNSCSKFHKQLVDEIPYDAKLLQYYKDLKSSTGKTYKIAGEDYKQQLRSLILSSTELEHDSLKHYEKDLVPESKISTAEAMKAIHSLPVLDQQPVLSSDLVQLKNTLTLKLMSGPISNELSSRIAVTNHPVLSALKEEENLLGPLYVDLNPFDDCVHVASKFVDRNCKTAKFIKKMTKCNTCVYFHKEAQNCALMKKDLVPEIPYTEQLAKQVILERMAQTGMPKKIAILLAKEIPNRGPKEVIRAALRWEPRKEADPRFVPFKRQEITEDDKRAYLASLNPKVAANGEAIVEFIAEQVEHGLSGTVLAATVRNRFGASLLQAASEYVLPELKKRNLDSAFKTLTPVNHGPVAKNPVSEYDMNGVGNFEIPDAPKKATELDVSFEGMTLP